MKYYLKFFNLLLVSVGLQMFFHCFANASTGTQASGSSFDPILKSEVMISNSSNPPVEDAEEIGSISVQSENSQMDKIYNQLREEASKKGAQYIYNVKLDVEKKESIIYATICARKVCTVQPRVITDLTYKASGKLLRKKGAQTVQTASSKSSSG